MLGNYHISFSFSTAFHVWVKSRHETEDSQSDWRATAKPAMRPIGI